MNAYKNIINLIKAYLKSDRNSDESDDFCNLYMNLFYEFSDELYENVSCEIFEALDELNMVCDSYEKNIEIRKSDRFCIDENQLKNKITHIWRFISNSSCIS